jgi:hypothetical protein
MRIWLELNSQEAERIFDSVKEFTMDRMQTGIVNLKKEWPEEEAGIEETRESRYMYRVGRGEEVKHEYERKLNPGFSVRSTNQQ